MKDPMFEIASGGADAERIVAEVRATVARKMAEGAYTDAAIARAERVNLLPFQTDEELLDYYLGALPNAAFVDISDFEIHERRARLAPFLVRLKKTIWGLLKFYTYRLWSQQNQINGLLVTALQGVDSKYRNRIQKLEDRIRALESRTGAPPQS